MDQAEHDRSEGELARRRRIVREFIEHAKGIDQTTFHLYNSAPVLNQIGMKAFLISLEELLGDPDFDTRLWSAVILLQEAAGHARAISTFRDALGSGDRMERWGAASMLASCDGLPTELVEPLRRMFQGKEWVGKVFAAAALARELPEAVPVLGRALRGEEQHAVKALVMPSTGGPGRRSAPDAERIASEAVYHLKCVAALGLGRAGVRVEEAVRTLVEGIRNGPECAALQNVFLLRRLGPTAAAAVPALLDLLADPGTDVELRRAVAGVVGKLGEPGQAGKVLAKSLLRALKSSHWSMAGAIVSSLSFLGESPGIAVDAMIRQLAHDDPDARGAAAFCLGQLKRPAGAIADALIGRARVESNRVVRSSLADALVAVGRPAIPALFAIIEQDDFVLVPFAGECLGRIAAEATELMAESLANHPDARVRGFCSNLLMLMGPRAAEAVPSLLGLLEHDDDERRFLAVAAIKHVGPAGIDAAPALARLLDDPCPEIAEESAQALHQIGAEAIPHLDAVHPSLSAEGRRRAEAAIDRLGGREGGGSPTPDFEWVGNDRWLTLFVEVARILRDEGPIGDRSLSSILKEKKRTGLIDEALPTGDRNISRFIGALENRFTAREGRPIRLRGKDSTRPCGLTPEGERLADQITAYLRFRKLKI